VESKSFKRYTLPLRLIDSWTSCIVNISIKERPVKIDIHHDVNEGSFGISCLCPFGDFTDGDIILWEVNLRIELRSGDLLFFPIGAIHHSNQKITIGVRYSLVIFTLMNIFHYWQRKYVYHDTRLSDLKLRKENYRKLKDEMEKMK
jgi:hypothetical protein